jgi:hypothetical protein
MTEADLRMQLPKVAVRDRFAGEMQDMKTGTSYR